MTYARMADAAFATNIPPGYDVAAGYYGGPGAYHVWARADWARFPGFKLPIWVAAQGPKNGTGDGQAAVKALRALRVPQGSVTALDLETMRDVTYVDAFYAQLQAGGYLVWVYGSASSVFGNPPCNGYWVADYTTNAAAVDGMLQEAHVRAVQYAPNVSPGYDVSWVKQWTEGEMWHG